VGCEGGPADPASTPALQKPWKLDITDRPISFSTRTPGAFIAMSATPAVAPKRSSTTHRTASDVGNDGRTRPADHAAIVAATSGRNG
jgi:hypothetical protein